MTSKVENFAVKPLTCGFCFHLSFAHFDSFLCQDEQFLGFRPLLARPSLPSGRVECDQVQSKLS